MRRHWTTRLFGTFLAFWFSLSVGEVAVVHSCPMHGNAMAMQRMSSHAAQAAASADGHAPSNPPQPHQCTCIVCACAGVAAMALPSVAATIAVATESLRAPTAYPTTSSPARPAPDFVRPYPTGPPRA